MEFNHSFTDAHGAVLTNAVIRIQHVNIEQHSSTEYITETDKTQQNSSAHLNVFAEYWLNRAAKEAGKQSYQLSAPDGGPLQKTLGDSIPKNLPVAAKQYILELYPQGDK